MNRLVLSVLIPIVIQRKGNKMAKLNIHGDDNYSSKENRESGKDGDRTLDLRARRSFSRKKVCRFCADNEIRLDYKDVRLMQSFLSERGKLVPRRISGNCAMHQRKLTTAVKRARHLALVGFISSGTHASY